MTVSHQQIARYGLLALAGLSAEAAHAGVVTSSSIGFTPFTITAGQTQTVDFGSGIGSVFQFAAPGGASYASFVIQFGPNGSGQQQVGNGNDPLRLGTNYLVSAGRNFNGIGNGTGQDIAGGSAGFWNGPQGTQQQGYLGVRFQSSALSAGNHYGFFDIVYDNTPITDSGAMTVRGWAYETDANTAILTPGGTAATDAPEPGSLALVGLGLLSCGGAGIRTLRQMTKSSGSSELDA